MDRTDVTPDPDALLETALTDPESFDAARTARAVAQLEHDDPEVQRAASWALRFVAAEAPSLMESCTRRFRRALDDPDARPVVLRTLAVVAEHNQEAVAATVQSAVEAGMIDQLVGRRVVAGYQPSDLGAGGSVIADEGDETSVPTGTAGSTVETTPAESRSDERPSSSVGHPPADPPAKPPQLDRSLAAYDPVPTGEQTVSSSNADVRFTVGGQEFTAVQQAIPAVGTTEGVLQDAFDRWRRIDDHDAVARLVDHGVRPTPWAISEQGAVGSVVERETPLPPLEARWVLSRIADAVHYAHTAGVVHGGLFPKSITFVSAVEDPDAWAYPRVSDWGLREAVGSRDDDAVSRQHAAPEHLAPDRFGDVDAATDIYGIGVIGHLLVTGNAPDRDDGTVRFHPTGDRAIPDDISMILAKCLTTAKMERYASAAAIRRDLATEGHNE
ncbi:protein kinase domain-containing protein [Halorubrum tebenquichense]|uniref:protein kinase domain-containing protein n=1 Tax=Halorubrum tebenquichense TaxID=119434 RepID=UPI0009E2B2E4|nr:hypothetical protein [Halorubrum tebenquichense]